MAAPAGTRVELKVLVVSDGGPNVAALAAELKSQGVPYREIDLRKDDRPVVDAAFLADTVTESGATVERAHYQAVVLPNANPFGNAAELAALVAYEQKFGIPQVNAYVYPEGSVGLQTPTYAGSLDGRTGALTSAGKTAFGYLKGQVPFDDSSKDVIESWGYLAKPAAAANGAVTTPLVTVAAPDGSAGNVLVAEYKANNRRQLSLTFSFNNAQLQWRLLAPGVVNWMTGGVHLGLSRNYFSVHVDDILLGDARWSVTGNCTPGGDCPENVTTSVIRMSAADVAAAAAWQLLRDFELDMVYNANGGVAAAALSKTKRDALTDAMVTLKSQFRWTNHTWSHVYLGCLRDLSAAPWKCQTDPATGEVQWTPRSTIESQIADNVTWAKSKGLPIDPSELVTGEHSGLKVLPQQPDHNPNLGPALTSNNIKWLAADNSRMPKQEQVGSALTVPRYPLNVYYNVGKRSEQVDEYNWIYTSRADGGSGICEDNPGSVTCIKPLDPATGYQNYIVPQETRMALGRVLSNDPRPHFVHQGNIAEERILYPLLDSILARYRGLLQTNAPVVNPRLSTAGAELQRQGAWAAAVAAGQVTGYVQDKKVHIEAPASVEVPLTVVTGSKRGTTAFGEAYAGHRSAWTKPATGGTVDVTLP